MITAIKEKTEILSGGLIQIHTKGLPEYSKVTISAVIEIEEKSKAKNLSTMIGAAKGLYSSAKEVNSYIRAQRDEWE